MYNYTSLFDVFPIERRQQLTHFGLSNVPLEQTDLINFLSKLPPTVKTVELSFLTFMEGEGYYISLMEDIPEINSIGNIDLLSEGSRFLPRYFVICRITADTFVLTKRSKSLSTMTGRSRSNLGSSVTALMLTRVLAY
jgi:hypothetical protein